jgi:hypothetical protein
MHTLLYPYLEAPLAAGTGQIAPFSLPPLGGPVYECRVLTLLC